MTKIPGNISAQWVPQIPTEIAEQLHPYSQVRAAAFADWDPCQQGMLISTRFGDTFQLHHLTRPEGARKQLTFFDEPVYSACFCPHKAYYGFLFRMDVGGGEAFQLYYFDMLEGRYRRLTPGNAQNNSPVWSNNGTVFAYSSTLRNDKDYDIYLMDIHNDTSLLITENKGYWGPVNWSPDDRQLLVFQFISATESYYHILDVNSGDIQPLFSSTDVSTVAYGDAKWSKDGRGIYYVADKQSQFMQLHFKNLESGIDTPITGHIPWNVEDFDLSPDGKRLAVVINEDGLSQLLIVDTETGEEAVPPNLPVGLISGIKFKSDNRSLGLSINTARYPSDVYSLQLDTMQLVRWTESEVGGLKPSVFPMPELIRYSSFDQRTIPAFYYYPPATHPKPWPVLIYIHGGPESQFRPRFISIFQYWLNEMGLAILAPNVRGSAGYGKDYIKLDNGFLREDSVKDIGALLDWIQQQPELDSNRICVYGGSYGGYMVLASLIHYGDRLKAGMEVVGISNFVTFLKNTKSYRRDLRRVEYGDEREPEMQKFLEAVSPTTRAHQISRPLLVGQGLNDPRVPASEAEQIVKAVRENGVDVWYVLGQDEGHGFQKKDNIDYFNQVMVMFLKNYL